MTVDEAHQIAQKYLTEMSQGMSCPLVLLQEQTIATDLGWLVVYQSREYLQSGNIRDRLAGNAPLLVRPDGAVVTLGTAHEAEFYLKNIRKFGTPYPGQSA